MAEWLWSWEGVREGGRDGDGRAGGWYAALLCGSFSRNVAMSVTSRGD